LHGAYLEGYLLIKANNKLNTKMAQIALTIKQDDWAVSLQD